MQDSFPVTPPTLSVPDLTEALDFFTRRLGFRIDMIVPADAPQAAVVTGQGLTLRLETKQLETKRLPIARADSSNSVQALVISRMNDDQAWHAGRAGMLYRDLILGRLGGRLIASHIHIPAGGPVPDYAHYHKVSFQMIYCKAGWARLVYEDQGPPFIFAAGDCVLQPPEVRHRVLEASPGLEVIEIGSPALHETWADHALELPTAQVLPQRLFNGQRFVRHQASAATWLPCRCAGFEARDTGIAAATNGLAAVRVMRTAASHAATHNAAQHRADEMLFLFVLSGELQLASQTHGNQLLQTGDSCVIPAGLDYSLFADIGLELLEVTLSAELSLGQRAC